MVRMEEQEFEVKNPGSAVLNYRTAVTILNRNGEQSSTMHEFYDKFSTIVNLKAALYDSKGNKVKEYKSTDFKDRSAVSDGTLYQDDRVKYLDFVYTDFPYTIAYSYSVEYNGIRFYPSWFPASTWGQAVEKSIYTFKIPETMTFKYLTGPGIKMDSVKIKGNNQYIWSCMEIPALEYEPMSTGLKTVRPWVNLAPDEFEFDRSKANIKNWTAMGSWLYSLSDGTQSLSEATKTRLKELVKDAKTSSEKISILYKHLQSSTRYVGVQLGIGGYKPISADKVSSVSYGDCKGLSNYMKAMLTTVDIPSYLVVIGNGMPSLNKQFASLNQANHMILCVPLEKDTVWLECTSQTKPAGFVGESNSDRTVLLVTKDGGQLAQTPAYSAASNYQKRLTAVNIDENGSADIQIQSEFANAQYETQSRILYMEPTEQRKTILNSLSIPNMQIGSFNYTQPDRDKPLLKENINAKSSQLLTKGGDNLFITLNLLNRQEYMALEIEDRKTPFSIDYSYYDEDEIRYTIPKDYKAEFIPKDVILESPFGRYSTKTEIHDNILIYKRTKTMIKQNYPPEKYNEFVEFSKKIYQSDKQKAVLTKIQ